MWLGYEEIGPEAVAATRHSYTSWEKAVTLTSGRALWHRAGVADVLADLDLREP
jgi:hypothetical protein